MAIDPALPNAMPLKPIPLKLSRRKFLSWSGTGMAATQLSGCSFGNQPVRLYGGYRDHGNKFGAACMDQNGELIWKLQTPARVHEVCLSNDLSLGAVVARRPGDFIQLFNPATGAAVDLINAPKDLIFEGHALFRKSDAGQNQLWATASPLATSESILLKYNLADLGSELGSDPEQIPIKGLGPHQMLLGSLSAEGSSFAEGSLSAEGSSNIVIAVGGWRSEGRTILNADSFESGLVFYQPETGTQNFVAAPSERLSARHLAFSGADLWVGMQLADPAPTEDVLLYRYSIEKGWQAAEAPAQGWRGFNGYMGSVAVADQEVVATSPQGHLFGRWSLEGQSIATTSSLDIAGATKIDDNWWLSSGLGEVHTAGKQLNSGIFWDNHWVGHSV